MTAPLVDLPALRAFLVAHAVPGLDEVTATPDGGTVHRRLVRAPEGTTAMLGVTLPPFAVGTPSIGADGEPDAVATARAAGIRWIGLDADPAPAVAALSEDPVLGPLVRARPHLRVPGSTDAFETAVLVVLGQHVSLAAGRVFAARLVAAHGLPLHPAHRAGCSRGGPESHTITQPDGLRSFPAPEVLAELDPVDLQRTVGITGGRARTVVAIARAVVDGAFRLDPPTRSQEHFAESGSSTAMTARSAPDFAEIRAGLVALPGVGPWTADLIALRVLRDPDVFLPGDLVLRKALGGVCAKEAAVMAQAWRPHRSLAVLHLWTQHAIDPPR